jgi:CRP-like cAMP-binding protein
MTTTKRRRHHALSPEEKASVLRQQPVFSTLEQSELLFLAKQGQTRVFVKGQLVFGEGDPAEHMIVICSGRVRVFLATNNGEIVLGAIGPSGMCGELALLDKGRRSASVDALEETVVLSFDREAIRNAFRSHPSLALNVISHLAGTLRSANAQIRTLSREDPKIKVLRILLGMSRSDHVPRQYVVAPRPGNQRLADASACREETVSRTITKLRQEGVLKLEGKTLRILERALSLYADELDDLLSSPR